MDRVSLSRFCHLLTTRATVERKKERENNGSPFCDLTIGGPQRERKETRHLSTCFLHTGFELREREERGEGEWRSLPRFLVLGPRGEGRKREKERKSTSTPLIHRKPRPRKSGRRKKGKGARRK